MSGKLIFSKETVSSDADDTLSSIVARFLGNLESLLECERVLMPVVNEHENARVASLGESLRAITNKAIPDPDDENTFVLEVSSTRDLDRITQEAQRLGKVASIASRSQFIYVFTLYDAFIADLMRLLLERRPQLLDTSGKQFTFQELLEYGTIDDLRLSLMEKEIETLLRQSYDEQFTRMENKFSVKLRVDLENWPIFIEMSQRRHLLVHRDGRVTKQYLRICKDHKVKWPEGKAPAVGQQLGISSDYFRRAVDVCYEIGFKLSQVLCRKHFPDNLEEADGLVSKYLYELIRIERWDLAITIGEFVRKYVRSSSDRARRVSVVNLAQAYKWSGASLECSEVIEKEDWSSCGDDFQLAVAVLREDFKLASAIMMRMGSESIISKDAYREWPLFRQFRDQGQFREAFLNVFGHGYLDWASRRTVSDASQALEHAERATDALGADVDVEVSSDTI